MSDKKDMRYTYEIYKISSDYCDKFYIGSTRDFTSRKNRHKRACNNPNHRGHNYKIYQNIRENQGWDNWRMTCIEVMENTTKLEAEIREEQCRMQLKATLNDRMVTRGYMTREEYLKQYNEKHKDHIKEYKKQYNEQYHLQHKEQMRERKNEKYDCECGGKYTNANKASHLKTQKHQQYLDTLGKSI